MTDTAQRRPQRAVPPRTPTTAYGPAATWGIAALIAALGATVRVWLLAVFARANSDSLWGLLNKWDSEYYTEIARAGYFGAEVGEPGRGYETAMAFFPGFPLLIRAATWALGWAGIGEAPVAIGLNLVFLSAMGAGVMAIAARMGAGRAGQVASAIVVTCAPMSIVFSMPYTEALFGALLAWGLVALIDGKWWLAGVLGCALSAVRLTSVDFLAVFAVMVALRAARSWRAWAWLAVACVPLVGYLTWASRHLSEVGGYFGTQHKHWNSGFDLGAATVRWVSTTLGTAQDGGYLLSAAVILAVPVGLAFTWRRLPLPVWLLCAALAANVLLSDGIMHSRPRLLLPAALLLLPWAVRVRGARRWWAVALWVAWGAWFSAYMLAVFEWAI